MYVSSTVCGYAYGCCSVQCTAERRSSRQAMHLRTSQLRTPADRVKRWIWIDGYEMKPKSTWRDAVASEMRVTSPQDNEFSVATISTLHLSLLSLPLFIPLDRQESELSDGHEASDKIGMQRCRATAESIRTCHGPAQRARNDRNAACGVREYVNRTARCLTDVSDVGAAALCAAGHPAAHSFSHTPMVHCGG
jgi:hypothetical protein